MSELISKNNPLWKCEFASFDSMINFSLFWHRPSSFFLSLPLILEIVVVHVGFSHRYSRAESIVQKNQNMNALWLDQYIEENYGSFSYILTCTRSQMELIPGCTKSNRKSGFMHAMTITLTFMKFVNVRWRWLCFAAKFCAVTKQRKVSICFLVFCVPY